MSQRAPYRAYQVVFAFALGILLVSTAVCAADKPNPGGVHPVVKKRPDWSGWWYLDLPPDQTPTRYYVNAPFKPEFLAQLMGVEAAQHPGSTDKGATLKTLQCLPPRFSGFNGGFAEDIEFLFTPGRVTLMNESGLVRRIYINKAGADEADETNAGIATGRWEGSALVVETHALNPHTRFGANWPGVPTIGHDVRVHERISLRSADTLEIDVTMEAPAMFTKPFETTFVYVRDRGHRFHEQSDCVDEDRSIDSVSGDQRFDLTPPSNLPPPPSR